MWTEEKLKVLKELYCETSNIELSELLGISRGYITAKANGLGLKKSEEYKKKSWVNPNPAHHWSEEDEKFLFDNYRTLSNPEMAKKLGRTRKAIITKLKKLGIKRTKAETDFLRAKKCKENGRDLSFENVYNIALKFKTRYHFYLEDSVAYSTAIKNGWIDDVCSHMVSRNFSIPQLYLQNILETLFDQKCSYNDRSVITPLELDIYFPKFKIAWEYEGRRFHDGIDDKSKFQLCKDKGVHLFFVHEFTDNYRKYKDNIRNQLILQINKINEVTNLFITEDQIKSHIFTIDFPNVLSVQEEKWVKGKKLSEIRKENKKVYDRILKYRLFEKEGLEIIDNRRKFHFHKSYEEFLIHIEEQGYKTFSEMAAKEHAYRLMKRWDLPIEKLHKYFKNGKNNTCS